MWRLFGRPPDRDDLEYHLAALTGILPVRQRLREQATGEQVFHIPLGSGLGMPGPEEPSGMLLISIKLCLDEVTEVILVVRAQVGNSAGIFAITAAHDGTACQSAIIASAFAKAVEPLGAVRLCACPFANHSPFVCACEFGTKCAGSRDVFGRAHSDLVRAEDLVLVRVEHIIFIACFEAIPDGYKVLKSIMETDNSIGFTATDGGIASAVKVLDAVEIQIRSKRLVQEFNNCDHVVVIRVVLCDVGDCSDSLSDRIPLLPVHGAISARVVEAVLATRRTVKVDHNLEPSATRPADGLVKNGNLTLYIRVAIDRGNGPIADGNADMVETSRCDSIEVVLGDPCVPVVGKAGQSFVLAKCCSVGIFIHNGCAVCPVGKEGRRDPRFKNKPTP